MREVKGWLPWAGTRLKRESLRQFKKRGEGSKPRRISKLGWTWGGLKEKKAFFEEIVLVSLGGE